MTLLHQAAQKAVEARRSFEAWYEADAMPSEADWFKRDPDAPDEYDSAHTHVAWKAWQAALQQQPEPVALPLTDAEADAIHSMPWARDCLLRYVDRPCDKEARDAVRAIVNAASGLMVGTAPPALQHQEVPREPFARGSWQHAVDDQLSALGRTSQEFSTPREAVCWLLEQSAEAARTIAPHKTLPAEPTSEILEAIVGAAELEQGDPEDHRYDDGQEAARAIYKAVLAASPSTTRQQEVGND